MKADRKRESGFYWVRLRNSKPIVAQYVEAGRGVGLWYIAGADSFRVDSEILELLSGRLEEPDLNPQWDGVGA